MKKIRLISSVLAVCLLATINLTSCSGSNNPSSVSSSKASSSEVKLEQVELKWYTLGFKQPEDTAIVEKAMNGILVPKINATFKLNIIPFANYAEKINVMIASGDEFDVMFTSGSNAYTTLAAKGAFVDLTELLPKYAPELLKTLPSSVFDATKIAGKIYAVPNLQGLCMPTGLGVRKDLSDKYSIPSTIKSFNELDAAFDKILNTDKVIPLYIFNAGGGNSNYGSYYMNCADFFAIGAPTIPGVYDSKFKVINQYESDNFKSWVAWARKAYQKGWIEKNAATKTDDSVVDLKAGKYASIFNSGGPQGQAGMNQDYGTDKYSYVFVDFGVKPTLKTSQIQGTMNSISSTSKNKERAMMLLNLINTDKALYNTMCFGIEGTHYILKDGFREFPAGVTADNSKYFPQTPWAFGNTYNQYLEKGQDPKLFENQKQFDAKATPEPALGFNYDATGMKTQIAQVTSVLEEFLPSIVAGAVDPDTYLPQMLAKLKTAGADAIIADKQSQLDKFMASKK